MTVSKSLSLEPCPFHLKWKKQFSFPRTHTLTTSISIPNNINSHKFKCHLNQNHKTPSSITSNSKPKPLLESLATALWNTLRKPTVAVILITGILMMFDPYRTSLAVSYNLFFILGAGFTCFSFVSEVLSGCDEGSVLTAAGITTVLKLQVGLLGMGRSLQRDLNRIAEVADTSSPEGLNYILTETSLALLRHPDYCISGYSSVDLKQGIEEGKKRFNQLSIEERGKFDEETLVNVNNIKRQNTRSQRSNGFSNEYIVVTILAAAEGEHKLPSINGSENLKEALQKLGSILSSKLLAVEVLWTPQNENDTLSELELLEYYPLLLPL